MLRLNRWIAAVLAACLLIHTIPVYAFAETEESSAPVETATEVGEGTENQQSEDPSTAPSTDTGDTEENANNTDPSEKPTESPEPTQAPSESADPSEETTESPEPTQAPSESIDPSEETDPQEPDVSAPTVPTDTPTGETQGEDDETALMAEGEITDAFASQFNDLLTANGYENVITQNGTEITLTIGQGQGEILALLSQQKQTAESNYQNWNIKFSIAGDITLPEETFKGLGDPNFPFLGTFSGEIITIISYNTIFKSLGAGADLNNVKISWKGSANQPILAKTLVASDPPYEIKMPLTSASNFSPYIGTLSGGSGLITLPELVYTADGEDQDDYSGDVGLVCGSMERGTKLQVGKVTLTKNKLVLSGTGSVGSLVGSMGDGATLAITEDLTLNATLNGANAGGLVGSMTNATIDFAEGKTVTINATLTATGTTDTTGAAGGIAGIASTETGPLVGANVVLQSVKANGAKNTGVLYGTCTATGNLNPLTGVSVGATREVSGPGNCGGLFGTLTLEGTGKCTLRETAESKLEINTTLTSAANTTAYGGVAGNLTGARANALIVDNCSITSNINVGNETAKYPQYLGGIVAKQNSATVDATSSTVTVNSPKTAKAADCGFGGVTAYLGDNALLIADGMKIITDSYSVNPGGGGVVGSTHQGSIVYLKTSLDLSECPLSTNATSGQIVGAQDCSLIYAPGVAITRLDAMVDGKQVKGMELDDIGNYGEIYRIQNFLSVDDITYETTLPKITSIDNVYTLSSEENYACLALAWQSRGAFDTISGNLVDLKSKDVTITLGDNITLTGCGIGGLTRDVYSPDDTFTGIFNGDGYTITLDIGAENQANETKVPKGDGRIYWHNATGLFAMISSSATVNNLTLAGSIRVSNNKLNANTPMYSGGLAARLSCDAVNSSLINSVNTEVKIFADNYGEYPLYIGGLFGQIYNTNEVTINLERLATEIKLNNSKNGNYNHIGGAVGCIDKDANVTIVCDGTMLVGEIQYKNSANNIYAGGLVGTIFPGGSGKRTITLTSLTVNGFTLSGSASERMGGILGGIWANTDVTVDGLTVSNATLTANGAAALGGLVYRASGKWTVNSVDLSGLTIAANNASSLGLLVCQGGPYKDTINGSYQNIDGLYLEMAEHWDWDESAKKGYNVPSSISFKGDIFDEFVAYTAWADRSNNTPSYQITANGGGIISLKTANGTVNMTEGERNTYVNRTTVGQSKQTNLDSRYYYNLPEVKTACDGGDIDTAEELLIWSVYRYAASNIQKYFTLETADITTGTIGGTSATIRASFDMKGLSYYPINITNADVTVRYADVKFYNSDIETKEAGNKSTRGDAGNHSQHYTMHCALFLDFTADLKNATEYKDRIMTVNGVSFTGTVGVVNGGSGALLCGTVAGDTREGNTSICTVVLADEDEEEKAVSLKGLSVAPVGDYTPALINTIGSYAGLKANYVITTNEQNEQKDKAGSSLIGDVGGQGATGVSIAFAGTIKLAETGVFSKATLLNSLRYNSGSATYNFYKNKDYTEDTYVHNATHGKELSTTVEYAGKQGCYYDGYGAGYYVSTNSSFDSQNDFSEQLPYVALSPATGDTTHTLKDGWHEIAVNVLSDDITDGCGTYGHPYKVTGNLLQQAADYINTGTASDGWQVRISTDDSYHTAEPEHDVLLTYTDGEWKNGEESYTDKDVRKYLQSAYYVITEDVELANFSGIGTHTDWAFTGIIKGEKKDGSVPTVTLSGGSTAFIKYSYGSVIRDLNIVLNQSPTLNRPTWTRGNAEQAPTTFFGGVVGCVLGGDNIIENVTISKGTAFNVTLTGDKSYLIPVGGYVGVIAGGGVIFRGRYSNETGITGTDAQLYRNPIVGRVLGGYVFYEGSEAAPNNGDKNYTINKIKPPENNQTDLVWDGSALTVNNGQGLLILSAIVSSGGGNKASYAYAKGKARNADYDKIGADTEPTDYTTAQGDSGDVWVKSQTPYLLKRYAGYTDNAEICRTDSSQNATFLTDGIDVKFAKDAILNMTGYGNGYRGLSARYVSNAAFTTSSTNGPVDASTVVMRVKTFDGQNADVQNISMDVKEYYDDDFHMASMGGIFNIVWTGKQSGGGKTGSNFAQNLTLTNCNVSLKYVNSSDGEQNEADINTFSNEDGRRSVSVGGFIGMANDVEASQGSIYHNYLFANIHIKGKSKDDRCQIYGPNGVGALIGTTAMTSTGVTGYPGKLLSNGKWALFGPNFLNCSFSNINVSGGLAAGGLVGDAYANSSTTIPNFSGLGIAYSNGSFKSYTSCTITKEDLIVGQNATITARAKASIAGGLFGGAGMRVGVNDPEVNTKSGINVAAANAICPLEFLNVQIQVSQVNFNADGSNPDSGVNYAYAAGIIGRIGQVNPSCFYDIIISDGGVTSTLAGSSYVGGIQGSGYTNSEISVQRCQINSFSISGTNSGGLLGSGKTATGFSLSVSECKLENCNISGTTNAGGLVGDAASKYYLTNLLFKNTSITGGNSGNTGRLFGKMTFNEAGNDFIIQAAGISVFSDDSNVTVPESIYGTQNKTSDYIGYIAYADYAGTEMEVPGAEAPYVTVNPNFTLAGENKMLTGDAVGIDGRNAQTNTVTSIASRIWTDQNETDLTKRLNRVSYQNVTAIAAKTEPEISTFKTIQNCGPDDLPVLVLKGGDAGVIEDYLDVITNGGYSKAKNLSLVNVSVGVYYYQDDQFTFADENTLATKKEPASVYIDKNTKELRVRSSSYDNTRNRFSLVEVSFNVNGTSCYTVSVPVVVIRKLQVNFMSTFSYGKEFSEGAFANLKTHLLESTGNPFTAYLTYQYNRKELEDVAYDWQSYMDDGGSMLNVGKVLNFSSGLPIGTQMILLDCQNGNQAYQYTVTTADQKAIYLSDFTSVCNPDQKFQSSMAEILGVTRAENPSAGNYVETNQALATVRWKSESGEVFYYRTLSSGETTNATRYDLKVPDFGNNPPRENYYLVITVPYQGDNYALNGNLKSDLDWTMPNEVTCVHRYNQLTTDAAGKKVGEDDESSYQISSGYRQALASTAKFGQAINLGDTNQKMQVKVQDTITFSNKQIYGEKDKLFLKLTVNLHEYTKSEVDELVESEEKQFPVGTTGTVKFYVQNEAKTTYYTWDDTNNTWKSQTGKAEAASYPWESKGGNMELLLSADGTNALDLSSVRQSIKGTQSTGDSQIIVTAEMDIEFDNGEEVLKAAVPGSDQNGTDTWVQLHYLGQISTQETSLSYSAMRATTNDNAKYYRSVSYQAVLSMDAAKIDQLGINPLQLVPGYLTVIDGKTESQIDLTAALNLSNLQDIESVLKDTEGITFTLSLQRRQGDTYVDVGNAADYIAFDTPFDTGWSWTISKDQYYKDGAIVTNDIFDGTQFTFSIKAYVFTDQKDYANYKIKLDVSFGEDSTVQVSDSDAYVVYTFACIKPSFYDPTSGQSTS